MFNIFKGKNSNIPSADNNSDFALNQNTKSEYTSKKKTYNEATTNESVAFDINDDSVADLFALISQAIEQWSKKYGMEDLPNEVIFEQALSFMNLVYKSKKEERDFND